MIRTEVGMPSIKESRTNEVSEDYSKDLIERVDRSDDKDRDKGREKKGQGNTGSSDLQDFMDSLRDKTAKNKQRLRLA
jgi:hypothetical protein